MISQPHNPRTGTDSNGAQRHSRSTGPTGAHSGDDIATLFAELVAYLRHYITTRQALLRLRLRTVVLQIAAGIVAGLVLIAFLVMCVVLVLMGLAGALAVALDFPSWAGQLIVGGGAILTLAIVTTIAAFLSRRSLFKRLKTEYDHRRQDQRSDFGRDASQRAAAAAGKAP